MSRIRLTSVARDDLAEIIDFIREDSPSAARRVLQEIRGAIQRLARFPELGHLRQDLTSEPLRFWPVYSYLVVYRAGRRPLEVVRIIRGTRGIIKLLKEDVDETRSPTEG